MNVAALLRRHRQRPRSVARQHRLRRLIDPTLPIFVLALFAVLSNALLAFAYARGVPMGRSMVVLSEMMTLGPALLVIFASGLQQRDGLAFALLWSFAIIAILLSMMNNFPFPDPFRNVAIIAVFLMLGLRSDAALVRRIFLWTSIIVLAGLMLEIVSTTAYVALFKPGAYYEATRGVAERDWDQSGLFQNSLGIQGRFTFGLIDHRAASIFLEQVSLANYAGVICVFLLSMWRGISQPQRALHIGLVVLILLSNSTRTSTALALLSLAGYFVYPYLRRSWRLLIAPVAMALAIVVALTYARIGDDLIGRIGITGQSLLSFDLSTLAGLRASQSNNFLDSGYGYIIVSSSVVGAIILWFFFALVVPDNTPAHRRCGWALSIYLFANLMIGGTAIFSLKVAALLWLLVGSMLRPIVPEDAETRSLPSEQMS